MKRTIYFLLLIWCGHTLSAQTISLYFPHFAGEKYDFYIFHADKNDTIQQGNIPANGRLTLNIPAVSGNKYAGMARWLLHNGGGLDFVINGEDFSVSCTEVMPNDDNIIYKGSAENDFFLNYFFRQQTLFRKLDAIKQGIGAYAEEQDNPLYPLFFAEREKQGKLFEKLVNEAAGSPFYAARFRRISDFLNGFPMYSIYNANDENQSQRLNDLHRFVTEELSMDALYTSGLWRDAITQCIGLYEKGDGFIPAMTANLERIQSQTVYEQLAEDLIGICEQFGWNEQEEELMHFLINDGRINEPTGKLKQMMALFKLSKGNPAPALLRRDGVLPRPQSAILVFYESGCGPCENEMQQLKGNYTLFKEKGYEVISISADTDEYVFRNTAETFPWEDKYCDLQGFSGANFQNYGVIGTPTFFVIDKDGIIQGRYAQLADFLQLIVND